MNASVTMVTATCGGCGHPVNTKRTKCIGGHYLCGDCYFYLAPEAGDRVVVLREDCAEFGRVFEVDALSGDNVILKVDDSYKLFGLRDIGIPRKINERH